MSMSGSQPCPCGTGERYDRCCGPLHRGERRPDTAAALMRSRYSAFAVGDVDYLWRSWHPSTRPNRVDPDPGTVWTGLEILDVVAGQPGDERGEVEFRAHHRDPAGRPGVLHARSRFAVRAGRWLYLDDA